MHGVLDLPSSLAPVAEAVARRLLLVSARFDEQLRSDLPPVAELCRHVESYRGKMMRPALVLLFGAAAHPRAPSVEFESLLTDAHTSAAAVCEMVHMATLVHDDVLDEAQTRRRGLTVNHLHGNEAAVILGDHLLAAAYHLCSTIPTPRASVMIARASMEMCSGELLQLHHRGDFSLDVPTYFEIVERKTGELIATSCALGALLSGADENACRAAEVFGRHVGVAFQIQDDLLDVLGDEPTVGKPVGKDIEKGKLTLPMIHHLAASAPRERGRSLRLLEIAVSENKEASRAAADLRAALNASGSITVARDEAGSRITQARRALASLPLTPQRDVLAAMADAVITRAY